MTAAEPAAARWVAGRPVWPIGFGAMELSFAGRPPDDDGVRQLRLACEAGVGLIDTAEAYCASPEEAGHNERLIATALAPVRAADRPLVATKGGQFRSPDGSFRLCGAPGYLRTACERSLRNLGVEAIDLYYLHWPDPAVPLAESVGALAGLQRAGKIRHIGLCNVSADQLRAMARIAGIASVQAPLSPDRLDSLPLVRAAAELGMAFVAYWPLGGRHRAATLGRRHRVFAEVGSCHGVSPQRACLAWLLTVGQSVIPIPGSRRPVTLRDSLAAATLSLDGTDLEAIAMALGTR